MVCIVFSVVVYGTYNGCFFSFSFIVPLFILGVSYPMCYLGWTKGEGETGGAKKSPRRAISECLNVRG